MAGQGQRVGRIPAQCDAAVLAVILKMAASMPSFKGWAKFVQSDSFFWLLGLTPLPVMRSRTAGCIMPMSPGLSECLLAPFVVQAVWRLYTVVADEQVHGRKVSSVGHPDVAASQL